MNIKQLFCKHIWKQEQNIPINAVSVNHRIFELLLRTEHYITYGIQFKCVKCDKTKWEEHKSLIKIDKYIGWGANNDR
jgi:hypothetical protein